jgi:hypothetical protein
MGHLRDCVCYPLHVLAHASQLRLEAGHLTGQLQHCVDQNSFHLVNTSKTFSRKRSFSLVISLWCPAPDCAEKENFYCHIQGCVKKVFLMVSSDVVSDAPFMPASQLRLEAGHLTGQLQHCV